MQPPDRVISGNRDADNQSKCRRAGFAPLGGRRLLVIEDDYLVAIEIAETLALLGAEIAGMTGFLDEAMDAADAELDGALVDIQLGSTTSFPLMEKLLGADIPILLITGHNREIVPEHLRHCRALHKPFATAQLKRAAIDIFGAAGADPAA